MLSCEPASGVMTCCSFGPSQLQLGKPAACWKRTVKAPNCGLAAAHSVGKRCQQHVSQRRSLHAARSCCSITVSSSASHASGSVSQQQVVQEAVLQWTPALGGSHCVCSSSSNSSSSSIHSSVTDTAQQQQLLPGHLSGLDHANCEPLAGSSSWVSPAAAAAATWQVLHVTDGDQLSQSIVACGSIRQLRQLVAQSGSDSLSSKLQVARITVMAALLVTVSNSSSSSSDRPQAAADGSDVTAGCVDAEDLQQVRRLTLHVLQLLTQPGEQAPALQTLSSAYLQETLYAVRLLLVQANFDGQDQQAQQLQQQLADCLAGMPQRNVLSAVHACRSVQQLAAVVALLQQNMLPVHVKAAFVQLARLCRRGSSSFSTTTGSATAQAAAATEAAASDLAGQLLQLLPQHMQQQQQLQAHQSASILWSLGQLQPLLGLSEAQQQQLGQQLLYVSLAGVAQLNHRVCAMLLHGAARLQLQLPVDDLGQQLLQHTQQQLLHSDPRALATMLWALAAMKQQPSREWMQAFYSSSFPLLLQSVQGQQAGSSSSSSNSSSSNNSSSSSNSIVELNINSSSSSSNSSNIGNLDKQAAPAPINGGSSSSSSSSNIPGSHSASAAEHWAEHDDRTSFNPLELSALLVSLVHLGLQPPTAWLVAATGSCYLQLQQFGQQELAVLLWSFAKLQHSLPAEMLAAAVQLLQQRLISSTSSSHDGAEQQHQRQWQRQHFTPQSLTLLVYALTQLDAQQSSQQQQQQQQQQVLLGQLWQQLKDSSGRWPQSFDASLQEGHVATADAAAAADACSDGSFDGSRSNASSSSGNSSGIFAAGDVDQLVSSLGSRAVEQLQQHNAHDLALLAWSLGRHYQQRRQRQRQQQQQQQQALSAEWLSAYLSAAAVQLQRGRFGGKGFSMMVWGLGMLLHTAAAAAAGNARGQVGPSSSSSNASKAAAAFWAAMQAQSMQQLPSLAGNEIAALLWGSGAMAKNLNLHTSREWADHLACQCLDMFDHLSNFQRLSALQGLMWLKHPRGLHLLQAALTECCTGRVRSGSGDPQELLLLLRACVTYQYTPEPAVRANLLQLVLQHVRQMSGEQVALVLYLLGKIQQQQGKRQLREQLVAAAVAGVGSAGGSVSGSVYSSVDDAASSAGSSRRSNGGNLLLQQQQLQQSRSRQQPERDAAAAAALRREGQQQGEDPQWQSWQQHLSALEQRQQQQEQEQQRQHGYRPGYHQQLLQAHALQQQQQQQLDVVVSPGVLCQVVQCMSDRLHDCSPTKVAVMVWGLSQLAGMRLMMQQPQQQPAASSNNNSSRSSRSSSQPGSSRSSSSGVDSSRAAAAEAVPFVDCPAGTALLQQLYSYTMQHLTSFTPSELAAVLYSVHKLGVLDPPEPWLDAVVGQLNGQLRNMNGQSLAALVMALSGVNWMPPPTWINAFVEAAAAVEAAGGFTTEWQRAGLRNGLSALDPVAGQRWLQQLNSSSSRAVAGGAAVPRMLPAAAGTAAAVQPLKAAAVQ